MGIQEGKLRDGDRVRLLVPENIRLHNQTGKVQEVTSWGAHILTEASATGRFRAGWDEMEKIPVTTNGHMGKDHGYTGEVCPTCQGSRMTRSGSCSKCEDCGSTSGCS